MRVLSTRRDRLWALAWSSVSTGVAQALVQGLAFAGGILIVRWLPPIEYAYYTIATAGLGTMTILTDSGVNSSVLALGGEVWQDRARLGAVIATGLRLRRRLALLALALTMPSVVVLVRRHGSSWSESALIVLSVVPIFLATVSGHLLETVPRLHQKLLPLQLVQVASNTGRLALIASLLQLEPIAAIAIAIAIVPQWWANLRLRKIAAGSADWRTAPDPVVAQRISAQVRRTMPSAVYYALSGQLSVWLISLFGKSNSVAAVGALGRLAAILTVLGLAFNIVAVPRFARIASGDAHRVRARYAQAQIALLSACLIPVIFVAWLPSPALSLLGSHYHGLQREAVLMTAASGVTLLCGAAYTLGASRGVVAPPAMTITYSILTQAVFILILPLQTVAGVLWIGLLSSLSQWLLHCGYFEWRHRQSLRAVAE